MPKATLEFDLPEEREEFRHAVNAIEYYSVLVDFDNALRSKIKYGESEAPKDWEEVRTMFRDMAGTVEF